MRRAAPECAAVLACAVAAGCADPRAAEADSPPPRQALAAGVRRLAAPEYDAIVAELLGLDAGARASWPPETRQHGFTRNAAQTVDPVFASVLHDGAERLAEQAVGERLGELVPCAAEETPACAESWVRSFGARAARRPLTDAEVARYLELFAVGWETDFRSGVKLVLQTLLESPLLLYASELGDDVPDAALRRLTEHEIASLIAFGVAGRAPDGELLEAAARGVLRRPSERERAARRLLSESATRHHYRRFVGEWLGFDRLADVAKDPRAFPDFPALRPGLQAASDAFVDRVMIEHGASLRALLTLPDGGRTGILEQASFLASHAHESDSGPVLRGVALLRRVLCRQLPNPAELGIDVVQPPPEPARTTRQRFEQHQREPACAACHDAIDAVGFTFEGFDAAGMPRAVEAGLPVDTRGAIVLGGARRELSGSAELAAAVAGDPEAERCLARQVFRYVAGQTEPELEEAFLAEVAALPAWRRESVLELVVAYVRSDAFVWRRRP